MTHLRRRPWQITAFFLLFLGAPGMFNPAHGADRIVVVEHWSNVL